MAGSVLIVDDSAVMRHALRQLFSRADFVVCGEAENGRDALEKAQELYPDLIVMDLSMPVMSGIEAARILNTLIPSVPIIVFTEHANILSAQEAQAAGIAAVVSKSEAPSVLLGEARVLLSRYMAA